MQPLEPAWLTADASYRAMIGRRRTNDDARWMSVSSMTPSRVSPKMVRGPDARMVDDVKAQIGPGLKFRLEGESDDEIEIDEVPGAA